MDDVGQTLLNWAAAFGTQEMVEFLCQKGADVNKGQRSSSLHYAACFGRPQIAQVLLRFGANPDLRDEDGKTPLDKAREGNNEGHREVANILQVWPITFFFASPPKKLICFKGKWTTVFLCSFYSSDSITNPVCISSVSQCEVIITT